MSTPTLTLSGYGYANKTGYFMTNKERRKYGMRYRHGDKITVRLDLMSRTLHYLINDEDQGCAVDNVPKGAYRLACCMQFKEQKVVVTRFWSSLGINGSVPKTESTVTDTADTDKVGKEHETVDADPDDDDDDDGIDPVDPVAAKQSANELYADYKAPVIDPDAPLFGDDYGVAAESESEDDDVYVPAQSEDDEDDGAQYGAAEFCGHILSSYFVWRWTLKMSSSENMKSRVIFDDKLQSENIAISPICILKKGQCPKTLRVPSK